MQFIKTQDRNVGEYLRNNGYTELQKQGQFFVFLNDGKATFSDGIKNKIIVDNKLML